VNHDPPHTPGHVEPNRRNHGECVGFTNPADLQSEPDAISSLLVTDRTTIPFQKADPYPVMMPDMNSDASLRRDGWWKADAGPFAETLSPASCCLVQQLSEAEYIAANQSSYPEMLDWNLIKYSPEVASPYSENGEDAPVDRTSIGQGFDNTDKVSPKRQESWTEKTHMALAGSDSRCRMVSRVNHVVS
jgi:hypothetical protein